MTTPMPTPTTSEPKLTYIQHGWEKCKREPLVPIFTAATTICLLGASASLRSGNRQSFQYFLRARVVAQGITVAAMVAGAYLLTDKAIQAKETRDRALRGKLPDEPVYHVPDTEKKTDELEDHLYPPRHKTKVSDFTRRLREAEAQQKADEAGRK